MATSLIPRPHTKNGPGNEASKVQGYSPHLVKPHQCFVGLSKHKLVLLQLSVGTSGHITLTTTTYKSRHGCYLV